MKSLSTMIRDWTTRATAIAARNHWIPLALIGVIGVCDFITGTSISFGIFYLLPIILVAWWQSPRRVGAMAILAALMWLAVDLASQHPLRSYYVSLWNGCTRLAIFWIIGLVMQRARTLQIRQMDLLHYIVHDLRNPLTTFMNTVELVAEQETSVLSPDTSECVEFCRVAAQRMNTLINSILDLSRLEEGMMPIKKESLDVKNTVQTTIRETSVFARSKNIVVEDDIADSAKKVDADPTLLHRILVNLLTNAIKASPKGTSVTLRVRTGEKESILFSVIDSGVGVPPADLARVFDRFVQVQLRKSGSSSGFGLGLTFCRLATLAHGGRIWIENIAGGGACVSIALQAKCGT